MLKGSRERTKSKIQKFTQKTCRFDTPLCKGFFSCPKDSIGFMNFIMLQTKQCSRLYLEHCGLYCIAYKVEH